MKWSKHEEILLQKLYATKEQNYIMNEIKNRSWDSIIQHAQKLNLQRKINPNLKSNLKNLLEETPQSYYWLGFLFADGYFNFKDLRLKVTLASKDVEHLNKFSTFMDKQEKIILDKKNQCTFSVKDVKLFNTLTDKFGILSLKTKNPPTKIVNILSVTKLISLIIGFIDGDGYIGYQTNRDDYKIVIKGYYTWLPIFKFFEKTLNNLTNTSTSCCKINNAGYAQFNITNIKIVRFLKLCSEILHLPVLERKWFIIQTNKVNKCETFKQKQHKIKTLLLNGNSIVKTAKILNASRSGVWEINQTLLKEKLCQI